ncbi:hypothetical protein, variant [Verruconis gallopava]|nr:hypothetical protein, variant [Verruconis gallopava]KIV99332.1 hypothetical protein, variant [Verruconis gallopava]
MAKAAPVRRCGFRRILPACLFPTLPPANKGKSTALPSEATLRAIDMIDRSFNDEEIAMVLQHEEFSQDLSGRRHSFDQHWVDPTEYNYEAGPSAKPTSANTRNDNAGAERAIQNPFAGTGNKQQDLPAVCLQRECGICMDDGDDNAPWTWLPCTHQFHTSCVLDWLETANRCPVCRTECT